MIVRIGFIFLTFILFCSSVSAEEAKLLVDDKGAFYLSTKISDTGITIDVEQFKHLTNVQLKSIIEERNKIPLKNNNTFSTISWNEWYTKQIFTRYYTHEVSLKGNKIEINYAWSSEKLTLFNPSLYLAVGFILIVLFSSFLKEGNKVIISVVSGMLAVIIFSINIGFLSILLPENDLLFSYKKGFIIASSVFTIVALMSVLLMLKNNLNLKFYRLLASISMMIVGTLLYF